VIVAFNGAPVRPGVHDGAATFAVNVMARLPEALPEAQHVFFVQEGVPVPTAANVEVRHVSGSGVRRVVWETARLGTELRKARVDVLVSPHESLPLRPGRVVVVAQNLAYHGPPPAFLGGGRRERVRARVQRSYYRSHMTRTYARASAVIAVSETTARVLAERAGLDRSKTTVVLEGADSILIPDPPAAPPGRAANRLLHVSTLAPYKNLEAAVDTLAALPSVELVLVGGDWNGFGAVVRRRAATRGVADRVRFVGPVEPAELAEHYLTSTLLLHLSKVESFGLPAAEAMRFGLPVVCAAGSAVAEVADAAAVSVDPAQPAAVAATVERLLASPGELDRMRARGLVRAGELTWRRTADGIAEVVRRVLA
jgi:glycosyltransferase involved in cell wall biosynthesis